MGRIGGRVGRKKKWEESVDKSDRRETRRRIWIRRRRSMGSDLGAGAVVKKKQLQKKEKEKEKVEK